MRDAELVRALGPALDGALIERHDSDYARRRLVWNGIFSELGRPASGSLGGVTFLDLQSRSDDHFRWGRRYYSKGGFFEAISAEAVSLMTASIAQAPTPDCEIYVLQLGGAVADVPDEATAYTGRLAGYYWIVEPVWDDRPMTLAACPGAAKPRRIWRPFRPSPHAD